MDYSVFDVWDFKRDDANRWSWRRLTADGDLRMSARDTFEHLDDCIEDARRCGYMGAPMPLEYTEA